MFKKIIILIFLIETIEIKSQLITIMESNIINKVLNSYNKNLCIKMIYFSVDLQPKIIP